MPRIENIEELREHLARDLRILMVAVSDAWGGLERTAVNDARILAESGLRIVLLVKRDSPMDRNASSMGDLFEVVRYPHAVKKFLDIPLIRRVRGLIEELKINLVHCHQGTLLSSIVPALWNKRRIGLVLTRHILNDHNKRDPYHAILYRRVDYILVLSKTMRLNLFKTYPVPEKKLRIVSLGLDLTQFNIERESKADLRKEWNIDADSFLLGVVGRLDPMKRQDLVIKAMAKIRSKIPRLHLVIVGAESSGLNGSYLASLNQTIRDLQMERYVSIVGEDKRIPEVMSTLNLFIMPSQEEAFGLVALEAMAMGIPTMLARAGSAEELAYNGRGELFRTGDAFDLSRKIKNLYLNAEYRAQLSTRARAFVQRCHSLEHRLAGTLEVYGRCSRRRRIEASQ